MIEIKIKQSGALGDLRVLGRKGMSLMPN